MIPYLRSLFQLFMTSPVVSSRSFLRRLCLAEGTPCILVTNVANIRYLTGLDLSVGHLLLRPDRASLFVDGRYTEQAKTAELGALTVHPLTDFPLALAASRKVSCEYYDLTAERLLKVQKKYKNTKFVQLSDCILELRRSKMPHELRSIRRACTVTKKVLRMIPSLLRRGMTERELSRKIEAHALSLGAERMAFDTIVAFGENTSRPHHHPTDRPLRAGDLVQIDMGVSIDGYCSDYSRVFCTGPKTRDQSKAYCALLEAKRAAQNLVRAGADVRVIDRAARSILKQYGYDKEFCHSLGHGLGLEIHERPSISSKSPRVVLRMNEVITIEPGLYFEGAWGMRVEDTVVVGK